MARPKIKINRQFNCNVGALPFAFLFAPSYTCHVAQNFLQANPVWAPYDMAATGYLVVEVCTHRTRRHEASTAGSRRIGIHGNANIVETDGT